MRHNCPEFKKTKNFFFEGQALTLGVTSTTWYLLRTSISAAERASQVTGHNVCPPVNKPTREEIAWQEKTGWGTLPSETQGLSFS